MSLYKIAGFVIEINCKYDYIHKQCEAYRCAEGTPTITVTVSDEEIDRETEGPNGIYSRGYCESICAYRKLGLSLPEHDAFIMHASSFTIDGTGYAITAPSGTGKSTHTRLLHSVLGDRMDIINGDKPIIRMKDGVPYACGSPWCGKERWSKNRCAPLKGIVFIERSEHNFIEPLPKKTAAVELMHQILRPHDAESLKKTLEMTNTMLEYADTWRLGCNISEEAAYMTYKTITGVENED